LFTVSDMATSVRTVIVWRDLTLPAFRPRTSNFTATYSRKAMDRQLMALRERSASCAPVAEFHSRPIRTPVKSGTGTRTGADHTNSA
jgi:hypothetical protein